MLQGIFHHQGLAMIANDYAIKLLRWVARAVTVLLLLFWGAFFLEHMSWFSTTTGTPPPGVVVRQLFHLLLLTGYLLALKWELTGSVIITIGAVAFFGTIGMLQSIEGVLMLIISIAPADLFLILWVQKRMRMQGMDSASMQDTDSTGKQDDVS